jgi:hypothetical protein
VRHTPITWDVWAGAGVLAAVALALLYVERFVIASVHETGHALAAILTGQPVVSLRIGPVQVGFERRVKHIRWAKGTIAGGATLSLLLKDWAARFRLATVFAAGVFTPFVLAGAAAWSLLKLPAASSSRWQGSPAANLAGTTLTWYGIIRVVDIILIAEAFFTGILNRLERPSSDGAHLREALLGGDAFRRLTALRIITGRNRVQRRPCDWDKDGLMEGLRQQGETGMTIETRALSYWHIHFWLLDQGKVEEAGQDLDRAMIWARSLRANAAAEFAYFTARHRSQSCRDAQVALAQRWKKRADAQKCDRALLRRAEAAIALAMEDIPMARSSATLGREVMKQTHEHHKPFSGLDLMRMQQLEKLKDESERLPMAPPPGAGGGGLLPYHSPGDWFPPEIEIPPCDIEPPEIGLCLRGY